MASASDDEKQTHTGETTDSTVLGKYKWLTAPYIEEKRFWPQEGHHILAQFDGDTIVVYQAFNPGIADYAVQHQKFGGALFSFSRMSWIKTNFLWMMYRCGWATKRNQERILAVRITRHGFTQILSRAHTAYLQKSKGVASEAIEVRLQWDPDHSPTYEKLQRRAIQLGLKGETLRQYATEWIVSIDDITDFVKHQRRYTITEGHESLADQRHELMVARERVYDVGNVSLAARINVDFYDHTGPVVVSMGTMSFDDKSASSNQTDATVSSIIRSDLPQVASPSPTNQSDATPRSIIRSDLPQVASPSPTNQSDATPRSRVPSDLPQVASPTDGTKAVSSPKNEAHSTEDCRQMVASPLRGERWKAESYTTQQAIWPASGKHILAQYDEASIVIYQAFKPAIADYAVQHQQLGGPSFSFDNLTYIKASFLWMMRRSDWARKKNQKRILALRIKQDGFLDILQKAVYCYKSEFVAGDDNVTHLEWDPDFDHQGEETDRRAIVLGLKGQMLKKFATEWIISIEDITSFVKDQYEVLISGSLEHLYVAKQRVFPVKDEAIAQKIGLDA